MCSAHDVWGRVGERSETGGDPSTQSGQLTRQVEGPEEPRKKRGRDDQTPGRRRRLGSHEEGGMFACSGHVEESG